MCACGWLVSKWSTAAHSTLRPRSRSIVAIRRRTYAVRSSSEPSSGETMNRNWCFSPGRGCSKRSAAYRPSPVVEHALRAVLLDAIALDVAQVQGGGLGAGRPHAQQVRLNDNAARAGLKRVNAARAAPGPSADARQERIAERARSVGRRPRAASTHPRPKNRQFIVAFDFCHRISVVLSAGSLLEKAQSSIFRHLNLTA